MAEVNFKAWYYWLDLRFMAVLAIVLCISWVWYGLVPLLVGTAMAWLLQPLANLQIKLLKRDRAILEQRNAELMRKRRGE